MHVYTTEWEDGSLIVWDYCRTTPSIRIYEDGDVAEKHGKLAYKLNSKLSYVMKKHVDLKTAKEYIESKVLMSDYWIHFYTIPYGYIDNYGKKKRY